MRNRLLLALAAAALALPGAASAQAPSDNITATAVVLSPISVTGTDGLDFLDVLPGVPMTVAPGDAAAGAFLVTGAADETVVLDFTVPGTLAGQGSAAGFTLPISFGAGSAAWDNGGGATAFDPAANANATLDGTGGLDVFIGGTVTPAFNQTAGSYTGTITLTVTYPTV